MPTKMFIFIAESRQANLFSYKTSSKIILPNRSSLAAPPPMSKLQRLIGDANTKTFFQTVYKLRCLYRLTQKRQNPWLSPSPKSFKQ